MALRHLRTLVLMLALGLASCHDAGHLERMHPAAVSSFAPVLEDAIIVSAVSGASPSLSDVGVSASEFKRVLEYALRASNLLAPSGAEARWRLEAKVEFHQLPGRAFSAQQVDSVIAYHLYEQPSGLKVFEHEFRTTNTKPTYTVTGSAYGYSSEVVRLRNAGYEMTVRRSLEQLLAALSAWSKSQPLGERRACDARCE